MVFPFNEKKHPSPLKKASFMPSECHQENSTEAVLLIIGTGKDGLGLRELGR
jgi:hypothetical protein